MTREDALIVAVDSRAATRLRAALLRHGIAADVVQLDALGLAAARRFVRQWDASPPVQEERLALLRPREREILCLLLAHHRVPAIARSLDISAHTVRNHLKNVFRRTGTATQSDLLRWACGDGVRTASMVQYGHLQTATASDYRNRSPRPLVAAVETNDGRM